MVRIRIESDQREAVISLIENSLAVQRKTLQAGLKRAKARLKDFEKEFGQSSENFIAPINQG